MPAMVGRALLLLAAVARSGASPPRDALGDTSLMQMYTAESRLQYTPAPTEAPTPGPTLKPGKACPCLKDACFDAYDRDDDGCLSNYECDLQADLTGCHTRGGDLMGVDGPWDMDGDGCINISVEWPRIYEQTAGAVCPVTVDKDGDLKDCDPGFFLTGNPPSCVQCNGGATRRRRSFECSECEPGTFDAGDFDTCLCTKDVYISNDNAIMGSVDITVNTLSNLRVGDNVTVGGRSDSPATTMTSGGAGGGPGADPGDGGADDGGDGGVVCDPQYDICPGHIWETAVISSVGRGPGGNGVVLTIDRPLTHTYAKYDALQITCTTTDGSEISRKHSESCNGLLTCKCGQTACDQYKACSINNGTGTCLPVGPYPKIPTPAPTVGAKGDPHLVNIQGEHFDINHGGGFTFLRVPQSTAKPAELELHATVNPEFEKPCTTYITQVQFSGKWFGNSSLQVRCYRKAREGKVEGAYFGARMVATGAAGGAEPPWQPIETFDADDQLLSPPQSQEDGVEVTLTKSQWFPKKVFKEGVPTVAGMFTLTLRNMKSSIAAKVIIRQDLPEQEHLNLAVQKMAALGRLDVGGLLGFDAHPENLEYHSAACNHHRATAPNKARIESQEDAGYYLKPAWRERWSDIVNKRKHGGSVGSVGASGHYRDNEAAASLVTGADSASSGSLMCKCPTSGGPFAEGVLIEEPAARFAEASWD